MPQIAIERLNLAEYLEEKVSISTSVMLWFSKGAGN